jgi:hypothetical protein
MTDNLYKKAQFQNQRDQAVMTGKGAADIANRKDKDANASNIAAMEGNFGTSIQQLGKDINTNKRSNVLANLAGQLSKYGLAANADGTISKKTD